MVIMHYEKDEVKKTELEEAFCKENLPKYFGRLNKLITVIKKYWHHYMLGRAIHWFTSGTVVL